MGGIVVGVSGHRFLAEPAGIIAGIEMALNRIEKVFGQPLTALSALAEGADRLVVERLLRRPNSGLEVVMPLSERDYVRDFGSGASKREFVKLLNRAAKVVNLGPQPTREEAYEAAGDYVIHNSGALIVIWDGQLEQGRGGTGQMVSLGRALKLPIAWVHAGNRKPGTRQPTTLGPEQGIVTFENF